jgi:hypothetical protein
LTCGAWHWLRPGGEPGKCAAEKDEGAGDVRLE